MTPAFNFPVKIRIVDYNVNSAVLDICIALAVCKDFKMEDKLVSKEEFENIDNGLLVRAPAKINLSLLIAGKRPDGYHEIKTMMAKVDWYDELLFENSSEKGIELVCKGPRWAPEGQDNLVYKACELLSKHSAIQPSVKVTLHKNIPAGTGLGSASSDAAAALKGLNRFLNLGMRRPQLLEMAAELGSDVPFFIDGPIAYCTGRGEKIENIQTKFDFSALLILPDVSVSTKVVYEKYEHENKLFDNLNAKINQFIEKKRIDLLSLLCANMLEKACFQLYERLGDLKRKIELLGLGPLCLSGSGSALYFIIQKESLIEAGKYQSMLKNKFGCESMLVNNNSW